MAVPEAFVREVKKTLRERILQHKLDPHQERQKIAVHLREIIEHTARKNRLEIEGDDLLLLEESVINEIIGFGLIDAFIHDPEVTDIFINAPDQVYVEKNGRAVRVKQSFENNSEILFLIDKMIIDSGRRIDHASPFVDFKLKGGLRVTAVIPPVASASPIFTIRKMSKEKFSFEDLKRLGTINDKVLKFIEGCVKSRVNILVSGSTGTGKTTLTNLMIREFVPEEERLVIIEDVEEMIIPGKNHFVKLLTRPPNLEGKGEIDLRDLVRLSLHLRPDRIMVGEIRGEEAFHFLHAVNTGHEGSMCTIHASNPEDALNRLEVLALMDRPNIQPLVIRRFLELGIDMIIQMTRLPSGQRIVSSIADFEYFQGSCVVKDIFRLEKRLSEGKEYCELKTTGYIPSFLEKLLVKSDIQETFFRS